MRGILFKAKRVDGKGWAFGSFSPDGTEYVYGVGFCRFGFIRYIKDNKETAKAETVIHEVYRETVSQFTGRYDNGVNKIFENDIVEEAGGHRSVVKYSEEEAKFVLESKYAITELGNKQVTVIGNVFDNADLMEK